MPVWPAADLMQLAKLLRLAGDCFVARRVLQRLDDGSLTIPEAIIILQALLTERRM